jgi:hypothetical protein
MQKIKMLDSIVGNAEISERSKKYGEELPNAIIDYMKTDLYDYTRENNIYESPSVQVTPLIRNCGNQLISIRPLSNLISVVCAL